MTLSARQIKNLELRANLIRQEIIKMLAQAQSGHSAGSLSVVEILTALYFKVLRYDAKHPDWEKRDRFVVSNGHVCPALYAVLAEAGYFSKEKLGSLRQLGSPLQGHPYRLTVPGLETTSGPLGSGLSRKASVMFCQNFP